MQITLYGLTLKIVTSTSIDCNDSIYDTKLIMPQIICYSNNFYGASIILFAEQQELVAWVWIEPRSCDLCTDRSTSFANDSAKYLGNIPKISKLNQKYHIPTKEKKSNSRSKNCTGSLAEVHTSLQRTICFCIKLSSSRCKYMISNSRAMPGIQTYI